MKFSGRNTTLQHKWAEKHAEEAGLTLEEWLKANPPKEEDNCLKKVTFFDVQWSDCPVEVEDVVKKLWRLYELGNDNYILKRTIQQLEEYQGHEVEHWDDKLWSEKNIGWHKVPLDVMPLVEFLRSKGIAEDEDVIIHWWW